MESYLCRVRKEPFGPVRLACFRFRFRPERWPGSSVPVWFEFTPTSIKFIVKNKIETELWIPKSKHVIEKGNYFFSEKVKPKRYDWSEPFKKMKVGDSLDFIQHIRWSTGKRAKCSWNSMRSISLSRSTRCRTSSAISETWSSRKVSAMLLEVAVESISKEEEISVSNSHVSDNQKSQNNSFSNEIKDIQDFYRRIPHFFMGRFKKWVKVLNELEIYHFLN